MNRWISVFGTAFLMVASSGCLHHNTRNQCSGSTGCNSCQTGGYQSAGCQTGDCQTGTCQSGSCNTCQQSTPGILNKIRAAKCGCGGAGCNGCGGRKGCVAGPLGWQQGGHNYSSHLQPGAFGHGAGAALNNQPFTAGAPSAQVGYPYYSVRGPRDFFVDNPPSIGR